MDWYQRVLVDTGRSAALWALIGFLGAFAVTRGVTRRIRARQGHAAPTSERPAQAGRLRDVYIAGVHVHHQVWGILLVLLTGLLEFRFDPGPPWTDVLAASFGAGAALALDEFALWFHLDDVYWGEDGRKSIDAVLVAAVLGLVLLLQATPVGPAADREVLGSWLYPVLVLLHLATAAVCIGKGKIATGLIGVVVPVVASVGALRLAKPTSVWARRRYTGAELDRAQERFGERYRARWDRLRDLVGGRPDTGSDRGGSGTG
ncbi:hypothetical protein [Modestobacter sp. SSW1-42]|uniref:hypothetical protein n=1 Tax=Modestobacter sp. SSW1-42 TaxID=596372 RepID=UPI003987C1BC